EVFISPRFVDYINPDTSFALHNSSVTAYLNSKNIGRTLEPQSFFGRPLFESAPFMEGRAAVCIPASLQASCKEVFNNHVYPKESDSIREKIRLLVKTYFEIHPPSFQDMNDVEKALVQDLVAAKKSIQEKLDPEAGNFLCLPYGTGGPLAIKAAKKAEMQGCFWVTIPGRRFNARGGDPFSQVRIKSDFIVRLPGEGRSSLFSVYFMKSARRVSGRRVF
ncbi:MAG: hypothetical protein ACE5FU_02790, partial [Nitrospinota bacterium]